jgi:hypothetical protein
VFVPAFSNDGRRITLTGSGIVTAAEVIAANLELLGQEDRIRGLGQALILLDRIEALELRADDLGQVADLDRTLAGWSKGLRLAVVVKLSGARQLVRMWEAFVAALEWEIRIFHTRKAAEAWLAAGERKRPGGRIPRGVR